MRSSRPSLAAEKAAEHELRQVIGKALYAQWRRQGYFVFRADPGRFMLGLRPGRRNPTVAAELSCGLWFSLCVALCKPGGLPVADRAIILYRWMTGNTQEFLKKVNPTLVYASPAGVMTGQALEDDRGIYLRPQAQWRELCRCRS